LISAPVFCPQFVGRRPELRYLIERRRDLGKARGGIVLVGGDAGIGKSRLVREFLEATGNSRGRVALGRCRPFASPPYEPLVELLATLAPAAAHLSPAQTQAGQLRSIADAFLTAAGKHAIVGVVEDLHWSDAGTLAVLALLAERLNTSRMLLVATYRANELGSEHPHYAAFGALQRSRSVAGIALEPLSPHDAREFIDATLQAAPGDVPVETRRTVARIAEGNPFFTEELLKSIVDRRESNARDRSLPATVNAAILERMHALTASDRAILTQAAVIGRRFDAQLLATTLDAGVTDVFAVLQRARSLQIVEETGDPDTFRFRHALTREAIYNELLIAQRQPLHRRIARTLEARGAVNASAYALDYHWWGAGDRAKTLEHGERCGDGAQALHAYEDSIESYERTLSFLDPSDRDAARVRMKIGISYFRSGVMDRALDYFQTAWASYTTPTVEPAALLRLARFVAAALYNEGQTRESTTFLRTATQTIAGYGDTRVTEQARLTLAAYLVDGGDLEGTRAILLDADTARIGSDTGLTIAFLQLTGKVCALQGDVDGTADAAARMCGIVEHFDDAPVLIEGLAETGIAALTIGETAAARRCFQRAIDTCVALELRAAHGDVLVESALERVLSGAFEEARALVVQGLAMIGEGRLGRDRAVVAALAVAAAIDDSELLRYEPDTGFIERVFAVNVPLVFGPLAAYHAQILTRRGDRDAAQRLLSRAVHAALAAGSPFGSFPLVVVAAQLGNRGDDAAIRKLCEMTAAAGPAGAHAAELAEAFLLRGSGDATSAQSKARKAAAGFAAIGWPQYESLARDCADDRARPARGSGGRVSVEPALTSRELEIARHVAAGCTNRDIGKALSVSVKLIEKHLTSIYAKLQLTSRNRLTAHMIARCAQRAAEDSVATLPAGRD
jgi:DNA-binding CsgD family transcriptional regulator/tetratricopeptide (TPR) repeat protein